MTLKCPFHNTGSIKEFDALDAEARSNPWPYYDWLREHAASGVYKLPQEDAFYVVHRYEDVKQVFGDTLNFGSKIIPTEKSPFFALMDGEEHSRIRSVISELFTNDHLSLYEAEIKSIIQKSTAELLSKPSVELFSSWADKIPLTILATLFAMDASAKSVARLYEGLLAINKALFVTGGTGPRRKNNPDAIEKAIISGTLVWHTGKILRLRKLLGKSGFAELMQMIKPVKSKMEVPRPDFKQIPGGIGPLIDLLIYFAEQLTTKTGENANAISLLRKAINEKKVTLTEMVMACAFILFAGYETTSGILSNCFVHLARNNDQFAKLKNNPDEIENFVEESLRYYTPVGRFLRRALKDVNVNGTLIPANSIIILLTGAANTDPEKFEKGCLFDADRPQLKQHLSFGKGAHFCIGAPLARMQITTAIRTLIQMTGRLAIDESFPMKMVTDRDNGILRYEKVMVLNEKFGN